MLKQTKILVTGATGFIGANIARYFFEAGANVSIFTRKTSNKWRIKDILKDVSEYSVDILDEQKLKSAILRIQPQIIFHTAVYGGYPFQNKTEKILETNFTGTLNLLNACRKIEFELFVNTGSSSEYGIKAQAIKETDLPEPITDYGAGKALATLYCQAVARREKRPIVILRLFSPYGYYEESGRLIPSLILSCLHDRNPQASSFSSVRDFIFIEDVMDAYMKTIENKDVVGGEIFNIGCGKQHSVGEVMDTIIKLTGNKVKPDWGSISNPRIEPNVWQADISKAKKILNWEPKYELVQGLKKTLNWFRENKGMYK